MIFEKYDTIYLSDKWFCLLFRQNGAFITTLRQWVLSRLAFCKNYTFLCKNNDVRAQAPFAKCSKMCYHTYDLKNHNVFCQRMIVLCRPVTGTVILFLRIICRLSQTMLVNIFPYKKKEQRQNPCSKPPTVRRQSSLL